MVRRRHKQNMIDSSSASELIVTTVEKQPEELSRRIIESPNAAIGDAPVKPRHRFDYEDDSGDAGDKEKAEEKKLEKRKLSVKKAAKKINAANIDIFMSNSSSQETMLVRFGEYFQKAFSGVSWNWVKLFRENSMTRMMEIPLCYISFDAIQVSNDWIKQQPVEALGLFVLHSLDCIFDDLKSHQNYSENSEKVVEDLSKKSLIDIFVVFAIVLRRMPYALVKCLPGISKYQGQDMLSVVAWVIAQVSICDSDVAMYSWARYFLPIVYANRSPWCIEIVLQLVEIILIHSNTWFSFKSGAIEDGERVIPPYALDILMQVTFPASSATSTARAIYHTLKQIALAGSKALEEEAWQIMSFAIVEAGEKGNPELSWEAASICAWCLAQNAKCYKLWDTVYLDNPEASVAILEIICENWWNFSKKLAHRNPLREYIKNFRQKNKKAIASGKDIGLFEEANKHCRDILMNLLCESGCFQGILIVILAAGLICAYVMESWNLKKPT